MRKRGVKVVVVIVLGMLLAACSISKEPAEKSIRSAENAFNAVKGEALKYAPVETQEVEKAIAEAKDKYDRKEYEAAFKAATALPDRINQLVTIAAVRKAEWVKNWESVNKDLSAMTEALQARIEELSRRRKLPAGIDKAKLEEARAALPALAQMWTDAKETWAAGRMTEAITKAKSTRDKAVEVMTGLGLPIPEAPVR